MIADPLFYLAALFAVVLTGVSKAGFGSATGGMAVPLMALTIAPPQAAAIMLPILLTMDAIGLVVFRGLFDRANLRIILPGALLGILLGALTFGLVNVRWIRGIIGLESILFALDRFRRARTVLVPQPPSPPKGWFWSTVSGFTSFVSHAGGPPIMQFLLPQGMDKLRLVGTTTVYFAVVNFVKLAPYGALGLLDLRNLATSAMLLPIVPIGYWIGLRLLHGLDQRTFTRALTWLLLLTGCKLLWDGIFGS
ncbi:MAG: sulfite exporter TauE/SafE family protein [Sterolibacterium sp.]